MAYKKHIRTVVLAVSLLVLQACSGLYNRDTPYDPDFSRGEQLFDQIPNWEGEALKRCAGHIPPEQRKPWQTGRC